jgi:hypothetical protein
MDASTVWVCIPLTFLMIPILAIATNHRRRMAELKYGARPAQNSEEVAALRREVEELKEMVHTQTLLLDRFASSPAGRAAEADVRGRLSA